jgi:SET domain-containing protein
LIFFCGSTALRYHDSTMPKHDATPVPAINLKHSCFRLRVGPSKIHRWGVYAEEDIPANRKVIEYTGEKIGPREAQRRANTPYLFVLDDHWTLDGALGGSGAQLINHSCEPNLVSRIMRGHVLYMSLRAIHKGEELTVDYNYDDTDETMHCRCGKSKCRGTINLK